MKHGEPRKKLTGASSYGFIETVEVAVNGIAGPTTVFLVTASLVDCRDRP